MHELLWTYHIWINNNKQLLYLYQAMQVVQIAALVQHNINWSKNMINLNYLVLELENKKHKHESNVVRLTEEIKHRVEHIKEQVDSFWRF